MRGNSATTLAGLSEGGNSSTAAILEISEELVRTIVYRTLSLTAELHVHVKNYSAARNSLQDLERLRRNDAETYILKIRVLLNESLQDCLNANAATIEHNLMSKRQPAGAGSSFSMTCFSKKQPLAGGAAADRVQ